jgi:hypothetical protein
MAVGVRVRDSFRRRILDDSGEIPFDDDGPLIDRRSDGRSTVGLTTVGHRTGGPIVGWNNGRERVLLVCLLPPR